MLMLKGFGSDAAPKDLGISMTMVISTQKSVGEHSGLAEGPDRKGREESLDSLQSLDSHQSLNSHLGDYDRRCT